MIDFLKTTLEQIKALRRQIFLFNKLESIVNNNSSFNTFDQAKKYLEKLLGDTSSDLSNQIQKTHDKFDTDISNYYKTTQADERYLLKSEGENYLKFSKPSMNNIIEINSGDSPAIEFKSRSNPYFRIKEIEIVGFPFKILKNGASIFELNNLGLKPKRKTIITEENMSSFVKMTDWKMAQIQGDYKFELPLDDFHEYWMAPKNDNWMNSFFVYIKNTLSTEMNSFVLDEDIPKEWRYPLIGSPYSSLVKHVNQMRWSTVVTNYEKAWDEMEWKRKTGVPADYVLKPGEKYGVERIGSGLFGNWYHRNEIRRDWVDYQVLKAHHPGKIKFEIYRMYAQRRKHDHHGGTNNLWLSSGGYYDVYWR